MLTNKNIKIEDYESLIGAETVERILKKAEPLKKRHMVFVNSTFYGGGVAELLSSITLLFNHLGITTGWRVIQGSPDFFGITKKMHNALQGGKINFSGMKKEIYERVIEENVLRNHIDHDIVVIHDPQPLPMINYYRKRGPWIWRCHIDLTNPHKQLIQYLKKYISKYDAVVLSLKDYKQNIDVPQLFFNPAIDPFSIKNSDMDDKEVNERLEHHGIPTDKPIVTQISRFDIWKDPLGVIKAFKIARKEVDATLVLLGNVATDDPEGEEVYDNLLKHRDERLIILSRQDTALVNALQRKAAVVLQKSLKEGFGLTVSEAMWKGTPVIGGNVGGIRTQIKDGINGFLVNSNNEAAERIVQLLKDKKLRNKMGVKAKITVQEKFLLSTYLEKYLDLFNSFEPSFNLVKRNVRQYMK
jgi:trehalose synthase